MVGAVISKRFATLYELETIYNYEDLIDMFEIILVNNLNENILAESLKNGK